MNIKFIAISLLLLCLLGCAGKQHNQLTVYTRTKDIRFTGKMSVLKGEAMLSVTWKYAKQKPSPDSKGVTANLEDCFRSDLVFGGVSDKKILFLIKNYLCGTYSPVNVEEILVEPVLPAWMTFHSMQLKILDANQDGLIFESIP